MAFVLDEVVARFAKAILLEEHVAAELIKLGNRLQDWCLTGDIT